MCLSVLTCLCTIFCMKTWNFRVELSGTGTVILYSSYMLDPHQSFAYRCSHWPCFVCVLFSFAYDAAVPISL